MARIRNRRRVVSKCHVFRQNYAAKKLLNVRETPEPKSGVKGGFVTAQIILPKKGQGEPFPVHKVSDDG